MKEDILKEYNFYESVMLYSYGDTLGGFSNLRQEHLKELDASFFKSIYLQRSLIQQEILVKLSNKAPLSIEGVEGCGKTTIIKKVIDDIDQKEYPVSIVDFNQLYTRFGFVNCKDRESWYNKLEKCITMRIKEDFFDVENDENKECFYEDMIFIQNIDYREKLLERFKQEKRCAPKNKGELKDWYTERRFEKDPGIQKIREEIMETAKYYHYVSALARSKSMANFRKYLVILDNIDRIHRDHQTYCFEFAHDFYHNVGESAKLIFSIRKENAHLPRNTTSINAANVQRIRVVDPDAPIKEREKLSTGEFHEIINQRFIFYKKYHKSKEFCEIANFLTEVLKYTYAEITLIDLANQSIRCALKYHCEFLLHLMGIYGSFDRLRKIFNAKEDRLKIESILSSHLYGWVTSYSEVLNTQCLNLVELYNKCKSSDFREFGCDLSYLILVNLYNMNRIITFRELKENFLILAVNDQNLKEKILELYNSRNKEFGHIISIWADEDIENSNNITDATQIELNYRGRTLIKRVTTKFTFINRLIYDNRRYYEYYDNYFKQESYYDFTNYHNHALNNIRFFSKIARLHTIELIRICRRVNLSNEQWFMEYARRFCVEYKLQLTRILESNIAFLEKIERHIENKRHRQDIKKFRTIMRKLEGLYQKEQCKSITPVTNEIYKFKDIIEGMIATENGINEYYIRQKKENVKKYII